MTLLAPIALAALVVPLLIYLVHWLFGSRQRLRVPALFLWADLPQASAGRSRRRLPPITLLLLLQLLVAGLAAVALARPATPSEPPGHLVLIMDASASMQATDVAPTRYEAARARGLERIDGAGPGDVVSVVAASREAAVLSSGPPATARQALGTSQPGTGTSAIREALALASKLISETPDLRGEIVVLTDAAWPPLEPVGQLSAPVTVVPVGGGGENQAITSVLVRMDPSGRGQTAFLEIANEADRAVRVPLRLTADGAPIDERQVDIPARGRGRLSIPLPVDARRVAARLVGRDALRLDDQVETLAPGGPQRDVLLVGRVSAGLRRAVESISSLRMRPADAAPVPDSQRADLVIMQGALPAQLPPGPLLLIAPPASSARLLGVGLGNGARVQPAHPLVQGLDLGALANETPLTSGVPGWARVVFGTLEGPLIMEGRLEGRPAVALTFDPATSGLEKSIAFPLLISNATSFLLNQADAPQPTESFDALESDIAPRPIPTIAGSALTGLSSDGLSERWRWLAAGALALLGVEWLVFARRG